MRHPLYSPPPQGVGMSWSAPLPGLLDAGGTALDLIEVDTRHLWQPVGASAAGNRPHALVNAAFTQLALRGGRRVLHAGGLPLAHSGDLCPQQQEPWQATVDRLRPDWVSAPLAFARAADLRPDGAATQAGILLPPLPCAATVLTAVRRIEQLRRLSGCPVAFRTVANPLHPVAGEMHDGDFYAAVADAAGCGIVLDLQALRVNERAGRATVREVLARLPLQRVWAVRLGDSAVAGLGSASATRGLVAAADAALLAEWLPMLPALGAVIVASEPEHWRAQGLNDASLARQIASLQSLWADRQGSASCLAASSRRSVFAQAARPAGQALPGPVGQLGPLGPVCSVTAWERALVCLVNHRDLPRGSKSLQCLLADPGLALLQQQLLVSRSRMLLKCLPLTWRALVLKLGQPSAEALRQAFWQQHWPEASAAAEAAGFAAFLHRALDAGQVRVPHLRSVLDYEMMCADPETAANKRQVHFDCEPTVLLSALARGEWPGSASATHTAASALRAA